MSAPTEAEIKAVFNEFDIDGSGAIDEGEIFAVCKKLGVEAQAEDIKAMILESDSNKNGKIEYEEFKKAVLLLI